MRKEVGGECRSWVWVAEVGEESGRESITSYRVPGGD